MKPKEHANLLGLFFWIYSGLQALLFLFILLYAGFMGFLTVMVAQEGKRDSEGAVVMLVVILAVFVVLLFIGLSSIVSNIIAGHGLRSGKPWARRWAMIASILSLFSFLCGGIFLLPFGVALGVYGLWFLTGAVGKYYFANPNALDLPAYPAAAMNSTPTQQPYNWQKPHGWQ